MIDANSQFFAILTAVGEAKLANANALGVPWKFTHMGVGDANNTDPIPSRLQTSLINEWRRQPLNQLRVDPVNAAVIIAEQIIPADEGGRWIREIGLYDADGDLVAVANCAPSFKPVLAQGSGRTQVVRMNFIVSSASNIVLKIDPAVVLATREYVDAKILEELYKLDSKQSVRVATTANIALTGLQVVDGVTLLAGDRVLVKNQTVAKDNGLYIAAASLWVRALDADASAEVTSALLVSVEQGTTLADTRWQLVTDGLIVLGTTSLTFQNVTQGFAPINSPALLGTPTAPTAPLGTNTTQVATTAFIQSALAALVNSSPAALDTLNELALALGNDANFATTIATALGSKAPQASPTFTGDPKAPTAAVGDNDTSIATTAFVYTVLAALGIAPNTTNTNILAAGTDLNTVVTYGVYSQTAVGGATLALNYPKATAGTLTVLRGSATIVNQQYQEYNNGQLWTRSIYNGNPSAWLQSACIDSPIFTGDPKAPTVAATDNDTSIATTAFVRAAMASFGLGVDTAVDVADANTITQGGLYRLQSTAGNIPVASNATILCLKFNATGAAQLFNTLSSAGSTHRMFWRTQAGGTWAAWREVTPTDSPTFTGSPAAPTATVGTNNTQIATTAFVQAALAALVNSSPATLDTLNELALALGNDPNFATTMAASLGLKAPRASPVFTGEVQLVSDNSLRHINGNYASFWRNDGTNLWLMLTNSGDQYGTFNALRPFAVNFATGKIGLAAGVTMPTLAPGANTTDGATTAFVTAAVSASESSRVGEVTHFAMSTPPAGYLKRNGALVSRTTYAALFAKIGTTFGAGDGSTTFALPDSRADFDRGWDDGRNVDTGRVFGSAQASQNLSHNHTGTTLTGGSHSHITTFTREQITASMVPSGGNAVLGDEQSDGLQNYSTSTDPGHTHTLTIASSGGTEARPVNTAFLACIKY